MSTRLWYNCNKVLDMLITTMSQPPCQYFNKKTCNKYVQPCHNVVTRLPNFILTRLYVQLNFKIINAILWRSIQWSTFTNVSCWLGCYITDSKTTTTKNKFFLQVSTYLSNNNKKNNRFSKSLSQTCIVVLFSWQHQLMHCSGSLDAWTEQILYVNNILGMMI